MKDIEEVICVDLDGNWMMYDMSWDSTKRFVKEDFINIFRLYFWYFR